MRLIVGLGNPGQKYEKTRHNLGFRMVEKLIQNSRLAAERAELRIKNFGSEFRTEEKFKAQISRLSEDVLVAKPMTYMNDSGSAINLISKFFKINPADIWIIHDDIDFPLGSIKIKFGGSSAGHNGVESVIESLGTDKFWRFRMGIGSPKISNIKYQISNIQKTEDFVLSEFTSDEQEELEKVIDKGVKAVEMALEEGMDAAMNRFNTNACE